MSLLRPVASLVCAMLVAGTLATAALAGGDPERGRAILEENCGRCHATGQEGASAFEEAPPFRTLGEKYPVSDLAESLAEGILSGHPDMPEIAFEPDQIDAIIAYLESIQPE